MIDIYDNVLDPIACQEIHAWAVEHAWRCESSIFSMNDSTEKYNNNNNNKTPLEQIISDILQQINRNDHQNNNNNNNNNSNHDNDNRNQNQPQPQQFVEYWSRDEYMNIDAHVDVDEGQLEQDGILRCPEYSHILYLQISQTAPTCILLSSNKKNNYNNKNDNNDLTNELSTTKTTATTIPTIPTKLVTVPCVEGRLVRFSGNLLHAVPRPPDRWLLSPKELKNILKEEQEEQEEMYFDDDDDDDDDYHDDDVEDQVERSVLLFNTWSINPPRDVLPDIPTIPDGITIDGVDNDDTTILTHQIPTSMTMMINEDEQQPLCCNPRNTWIQRHIPWTTPQPTATTSTQTGPTTTTINTEANSSDHDSDVLRIPLMGKRRRRQYATKELRLGVATTAATSNTSHSFRSAIHQPTDISYIDLYDSSTTE